MTATIIRNARADDASDPVALFPVVGKGELVVGANGALRWKILLEDGGDKATAFLFVRPSDGQVIVAGVGNNLKSRLKTFQVQPTGQMPLYNAMRQFVGPVHVLAASFAPLSGNKSQDAELRRSLVATYGSASNVTTGSAKRHDATAPVAVPVAPVLDTDAYGAAYGDAAQDDATDDAGDIPDAALTAAGALALLDDAAEPGILAELDARVGAVVAPDGAITSPQAAAKAIRARGKRGKVAKG